MTGTFNRFSTQAACLLGLLSAALFAPKSVEAALYIDLRFADGSTTHNVSTADIGGFVPVDVWARVIGADQDPTNEVFRSAYLGVRSTSSNVALLDADISSTPIASAPYNNTFYTPRFRDSNVQPSFGERSAPADSTTDLGGPSVNSVIGFLKPRSGYAAADATPIAGESQPASSGGVGWEWRLARFNVAINNVAAVGSNALTFAPYNSTVLPTSQLSSYGQDTVNGNTNAAGRFTVGSTISFNTVAVTSPPTPPDIDPAITTADLQYLLLNGTISSPVSLRNNGGTAATYTSTASGSVAIQSGGSGTLAPSAANTLVLGIDTSTYGPKSGDVVVSTPGDPDAPAADTIHVLATVGVAAPLDTTYGTPLITYQAPGARIVDVRSKSLPLNGAIGTEASIPYTDINNTTTSNAVDMAWRLRIGAESQYCLTLDPSLPYIDITDSVRIRDSTASNRFLPLQIKYDPASLPSGPASEAALAAAGGLFIGTAHTSVSLFNVGFGDQPLLESFADYYAGTVGNHGAKAANSMRGDDWGVDLATHSVWLVGGSYVIGTVFARPLPTSQDFDPVTAIVSLNHLRGPDQSDSVGVVNQGSDVNWYQDESSDPSHLSVQGYRRFVLAGQQDQASLQAVCSTYSISDSVVSLHGFGDTDANDSVLVHVNVGNAFYNGAALTASLAPSQTLAGFSARAADPERAVLNPTEAKFVGGSYTGATTGTLAVSMRQPTEAEFSGAHEPSSVNPPEGLGLISDVLTVTGLPAGDVFALQMNFPYAAYDQSTLQTYAANGQLFLADLSTFSTQSFAGMGSPVLTDYASYVAGTTGSFGPKPARTFAAHDWGVDTYHGVVWGVFDAPGSFAAIGVSPVPEPSTWALAALAAPALLLVKRRRRWAVTE